MNKTLKFPSYLGCGYGNSGFFDNVKFPWEYTVLMGNPLGKRPLERPRCRGRIFANQQIRHSCGRIILKWILKKHDERV
jgi:hypothetical protein